MKRSRYFVLVAMLLFSTATILKGNRSQEHRFQKAIHLMETKGDYPAAITQFEKVSNGPDRTLAARSLLYVGLCHEKFGSDEAKKAYQRIIRDFADQQEVLAEARTRLAALEQPPRTASNTPGLVVRRVWAGPEVDVLGAPSPDGRFLTYVQWETGDLAVRDLKTGENRRLTDKGSWSESSEFALYSELSPDGKQVAYAWLNKDFFFDLRIIKLDVSEPRVLYSNEEMTYIQPAAWSPDGKRILATFSSKDRTNQIVMISVADGSVRLLKTLDWRYPGEMRFSPDGRYIVYDFPPEEDSPQRDIFLLATDGSREIPLVQHPADDLVLGWAPDGQRILFASDRTGTLGAWLVGVSEGKAHGSPVLVKPDIGQAGSSMGFTADGSFYYGLQIGMKDVYFATIDLETGELLDSPTRATQRFVGSNISPDWSLDGQYLAYVSKRDPLPGNLGRRILCIRSLESGEEREISPELNFFNRPRWSPNGRSIVVTGRNKKNRQGLYLIDAETGDVTPIVLSEPGAYVGQPSWSPDGKAIFYRRKDFTDKLSRIFVHDLESGLDKELYRAVSPSWIGTFALSPDGRLLIMSQGNEETSTGALMVMSVSGGEPRELFSVKEPPWIAPIAWTPDGQAVLFTKSSDPTSDLEQKVELWQISAESGEPKKLELSMEGRSHLRFHPDGQRIAFTAGEDKGEVWVMENFLPPVPVPQ